MSEQDWQEPLLNLAFSFPSDAECNVPDQTGHKGAEPTLTSKGVWHEGEITLCFVSHVMSEWLSPPLT